MTNYRATLKELRVIVECHGGELSKRQGDQLCYYYEAFAPNGYIWVGERDGITAEYYPGNGETAPDAYTQLLERIHGIEKVNIIL